MPLNANLFRLESSILTRAKRAIDRNNEAGNSLNAVEHESVPTRVLNPNASEASYKPEQARGEHSWGEYTGVERSWMNFPGGSIPRTVL